jgi:Zn-dependent protease with chaperone function
MKGFGVNTAISAAIVWVPFLIIKKSPKRWWLYIALASVPYLFFMLYMQPVVIDPIFNQYKQIEDKALSAKIEGLLSKTTIGNCEIYEVDKSRETNQMNAYMTGVFNTKRIVLWDTTIKNLNTDEILCVTAHEMGHYLMGHVWKSIIVGSAGISVLLYFIYRMCNYILKKSKGRLGFNKLWDPAALPLLILLINLMLFVSAPISNAYSRSLETEADRFELELTRNNYASATSTVKLHQQSLILPEPGIVYMLWNYDHPTFKERVDFANSYKPWVYGKALKYQRFIKIP